MLLLPLPFAPNKSSTWLKTFVSFIPGPQVYSAENQTKKNARFHLPKQRVYKLWLYNTRFARSLLKPSIQAHAHNTAHDQRQSKQESKQAEQWSTGTPATAAAAATRRRGRRSRGASSSCRSPRPCSAASRRRSPRTGIAASGDKQC